MIPFSDERFNSLEWETCEWAKLDSMIAGLEAIGAEPIGTPLADAPAVREGVCIYFRMKNKGVLTVCIDANLDYPERILLSMAAATQDVD